MAELDKEMKKLMQAFTKMKAETELDDKFGQVLELCRKQRDKGYGQSLTHGRGDQAIQQALAGNPKALAQWQSLPVIQFLNGENLMDLWPNPPVDAGVPHNTLWNTLCEEAMENMIWNDCVFYWVELVTGNRCWARVRSMTDYESYVADPLMLAISKLSDCNILEQKDFEYVLKVGGKLEDVILLDFFMLPRKGTLKIAPWFTQRKHPIKQVNEATKDVIKGIQVAVMLQAVHTLYAYLCQSNERTVEVRPANPRTPAGSPKGKKRPWLRDDVPYIVLLDPARASRVGWQARKDSEGSNRKSPAPHDRRGHSRLLKAIPGVREAKRIWVRPAWIGPVDWEYKGRVYKVVRDRKVDCESHEGDANPEQ